MSSHYQGKPCKRGHVGIRRLDTGGCVDCQRLANRAVTERIINDYKWSAYEVARVRAYRNGGMVLKKEVWMNEDVVELWIDGACLGNPGPGGWAALAVKNGVLLWELSGRMEETTNNQMELMAAIEGLRALKGHRVRVFTDSEYVKNGIVRAPGWKAKGWTLANRKPAKNVGLWEELLSLAGQAEWFKVRAHSGVVWNEAADKLAVTEAKSLVAAL